MEYSTIISFLDAKMQPSLSSDANNNFKKLLALSIGSYFENEIQQILVEYVTNATNNNSVIVSFLRKKAIALQYHTYFDWGEKNEIDKPKKSANHFLALFGEDFSGTAQKEISLNPSLNDGVKAFIELGHIRNILTHSNIASYPFENKTTSELYDLYKKAVVFVDYLREKFLGSFRDQTIPPL